MASLHFEWDDRKAEVNRRKHRVSFAEAQTVFFDEHGLFMADPDHSQEEDRFLLLGLSESVRLLVVCHCYRGREETIRIISARKANRSEEAPIPREKKGMRKTYDFSRAKRNPYARKLKKQITIRLDQDILSYFSELAGETGIPYQALINLYLRDCATSKKKLLMRWKPVAGSGSA